MRILGFNTTGTPQHGIKPMKRFILTLVLLLPMLAIGATYPNYFVTNAAPFGVVPGTSIYVPTLYSSSVVMTNATVTDYLFIGTLQVSQIVDLGALTQAGITGSNVFLAPSNWIAGDAAFGGNVYGNGKEITNSSQFCYLRCDSGLGMGVNSIQTGKSFTNYSAAFAQRMTYNKELGYITNSAAGVFEFNADIGILTVAANELVLGFYTNGVLCGQKWAVFGGLGVRGGSGITAAELPANTACNLFIISSGAAGSGTNYFFSMKELK